MKVLYAIQGTGNGHVSRAREVIPMLKKMADVDVFLSGGNSNVDLSFDIQYKSKGLSFEYGNKGNLNFWKTLNHIHPFRVLKEIRDFPIQHYDLVINDFESISAYAAKLRNVPCLSFSHQTSLLSPYSPKPDGLNLLGESVLKYYAPAPYSIGLHFQNYDDYIYTPIIRKEIRQLNPIELGHYTVYLPAFSTNEMLKLLLQIPQVRWEVFSRTNRYPYIEKNVTIKPIQNDAFIQSLSSCKGLLTSAGFESPAEALYLNKKVYVIPIGGQYEQLCNAKALNQLGVHSSAFNDTNLISKLNNWLNSKEIIPVHFPDITESLVEHMLFDQSHFQVPTLIAG